MRKEIIETRLDNARAEIEHWREYDYVVVNEDLDRAFPMVRAILAAERLRRERCPGLFEFVSGIARRADLSLADTGNVA